MRGSVGWDQFGGGCARRGSVREASSVACKAVASREHGHAAGQPQPRDPFYPPEVHVRKALGLARVLVRVQPHFGDPAGLKQAGQGLVVRLPRHVACRGRLQEGRRGEERWV